MQNVHVKIKGLTPLLMHMDNIEWADQMEQWILEPGNKALTKAGDDRTPAWRWLGSLSHDGNIVTIPSEYIMRCVMAGAAQIPTGRGRSTFKSQSQSGMLCPEFHWPLQLNGSAATISRSIRRSGPTTLRPSNAKSQQNLFLRDAMQREILAIDLAPVKSLPKPKLVVNE